VEVRSSEFSRNSYTPLGVFDEAHLHLVASTIANNSVKGDGGGLLVKQVANVTITGQSRVHGNSATGYGGGLFVRDDAMLTLAGNSSVTANSAVTFGGGLAANGTVHVTLTEGSSVKGNTAAYGGGLYVGYAAEVSCEGCSIAHNTAKVDAACERATRSFDGNSSTEQSMLMKKRPYCPGADGGGLYIEYKASVILAGGIVHSNNAVNGSGGGMLLNSRADVVLVGGSTVIGNTAGKAGGGLALDLSDAILDGGSIVQGNTAGRLGGGLYLFSSDLTMDGGSKVLGNMALNGTGGGLNVGYNSRVTISNHSTVSNNSCLGGIGGGIAVEPARLTGRKPLGFAKFDSRGRAIADDSFNKIYYSVSYVTISNSIVSNNTSIGSAGGGLAVGAAGAVEVANHTVVSHNSALSGGGVVLLGNGGFYADDSVVFLNNTVGKGYVGSTIAAFDSSKLDLPRFGRLTKCSVGVYLGWATCQAGETPQFDMCVCCPQHTFSLEANASCEACPLNGKCSGGSLVQPLPGYWSSAPSSVQMHRCPLSTTACNYTSPSHVCNEGYTGPLCGACKLPWYGMLSPFRCGKCMLPKVQLGLYLLLSAACVVFAAGTVHTTWKDNMTADKVVLATDYIKVLVLFLQYTVLIGGVSVAWPLFDMQRWFQAVNIVFAIGSGQALSLDCWLHQYIPQGKLPLAMQRQLVYFLAPVVVLLAVVALLWLAWALGRWVVPLVWRPKEGATQQLAVSVARKLPVTLLVVAFYAYPTLLRASLSFFACMRIDRVPPEVLLPPGATAPLDHPAGYWVSDITQPCFVGYHKGWALGLGLPSALLWCIGVPVAMGLGLFLCRAKADTDSFREHFGFLYRSYKPNRMWWEAVWAARTVVLTGISVFAIPMERYFAVLSLLVVFLVSAALQSVFQPYAFPSLHRMHMVSTSCLMVTTLGALAMFAYEVQESIALRLRIVIAVLVLVVNVTFVAWCIWKLVPAVKGWVVTAYGVVKSGVLWVVDGVMECAGRPRGGQGRGRGRRGRAGCCV
jgi:hypothetical protein